MDEKASVVLVNGLWLNSLALQPLALRLRRTGFRVFPFSYPSVRCDLHSNADRLQAFLAEVPGETVHWVGYSLGGIVIRALFHFHPQQRPGRIVYLGSPQQGSLAGESIMRSPVGRQMGGRSLSDLVAGQVRRWGWPPADTGVIAGSRALGLGRLVARLTTPSDGTVLVDETDVPDAQDRVVLPVAHSAMLFSPLVARQINQFLRNGRFVH
ncbi:MAG TPA: hypothetical protein DIC36_03400 [Gammaproteobacteria bacterium]|nr:hypothetical protein [Gammaproteobacteria bacterium]